jgi:hypothetical protein
MSEKGKGFPLKPSQWQHGLTLNAVTAESASITLIDTLNVEKPGVDVNLARLLMNDVEGAVKEGTPEAMARLKAAYGAFHGMAAEMKERRLVAITRAVERALGEWGSADALHDLACTLWAADETFMTVSVEIVEHWIGQAVNAAERDKTKGGRTNMRARGVAAEIIGECGALGYLDAFAAKSAINDAFKKPWAKG